MGRVIRWAATAAATSCFVITALIILPATSLAASQPADTPPSACPSGQGIVSATLPAYGRQGIGVEVGIGVADPSRVSDASVSVLAGTSLLSTTPVTLTQSATVETVTAPSTGTEVTVVVTWDQDVGTPQACSGVDLDEVELISPYGSAGNPAQPRLAGSYNVVEQPVNYHGAATRAQWLFNSGCVYFACGAYLQSSGGIELALGLLANGAYQGSISYGPGLTATPCRTTGSRPLTIKNAYTLRESVEVLVVGVAPGPVSRIAGLLTGVYTPTTAARLQGCRKTKKTIESFTGTAA